MINFHLHAQSAITANGFSRLFATVPNWLFALLVILTLWFVGSLIYGVIKVQALKEAVEANLAALRKVGTLTDETRRHGQLIAAVDQWRGAVSKIPQSAQWIARDIERQLVVSKDHNGASRYLLGSSDEAIWTEESFSAGEINQA